MGTTQDLVSRALALESAGRWSEAGAMWSQALSSGSGDMEPGTVLAHRRHGRTVATCTYEGPGRYVYGGRTYASLYAAAVASAIDLGKSSKLSQSGPEYWGLEKRGRR